jgi:membrane-bound serine protease (ClpP class)
MRGKITAFFLIALLLLSAASAALPGESAENGTTAVYFAPMTGVVGVPMEEYVDSVFDGLAGERNAILVFRMDTPGGLVDSMSHIMSRIADSEIPVVVWVAPSGSRAASAGAFIVQAAHVAAMAPETNIGASHPVTGGGKNIDDSEMDRKVVNDLIAKMRSFAMERGRNAEVAESMVRESVSLAARDAFSQYVVDLIASDEADLIAQLDGRTVKLRGKETVISTGRYEIKNINMGLRFRALEVFSRPDIAYLALLAGVILIILEVRTPGGFVFGVTGAFLLLAAAYGLRVLPVNFAGVMLLVGGIAVIVADLAVGGIGILAVPGVLAMLAGAFLIYRTPGGAFLGVSMGFIFGVTLVVAVIAFALLRLIYKAARRKPSGGFDGLVGECARVVSVGAGSGMAMLHGEYWRIAFDTSGGTVKPGDEVKVLAVNSMILSVSPASNKKSSQEVD